MQLGDRTLECVQPPSRIPRLLGHSGMRRRMRSLTNLPRSERLASRSCARMRYPRRSSWRSGLSREPASPARRQAQGQAIGSILGEGNSVWGKRAVEIDQARSQRADAARKLRLSHAGLSDLPHSRQQAPWRGVISPQNGHIRCEAKSPSRGCTPSDFRSDAAVKARRLRSRPRSAWKRDVMA
jgi:hypothetical protein